MRKGTSRKLKIEMRETKFCDLGRRGYREVWELQERTLEKLKEEKLNQKPGNHYLFFVEHDPVYTLGKSGNEANMLISAIQLRAAHAEFIRVDRGGDITFHGPGQLVVYPIIDLEQFGLGVKDYVDRLEEIVIRTIADYGIQGHRLAGATGVWLEPQSSRARKICAIGVKCSRYVTMHGFALNVNTDLNYFNYIHPCGFVDKGVTSIEKELGHPVDFQEVKEKVLRYFSELLEMNITMESAI